MSKFVMPILSPAAHFQRTNPEWYTAYSTLASPPSTCAQRSSKFKQWMDIIHSASKELLRSEFLQLLLQRAHTAPTPGLRSGNWFSQICLESEGLLSYQNDNSHFLEGFGTNSFWLISLVTPPVHLQPA